MILLLFFLAFLTPHWQELPEEGGPVGIGGNVWQLWPREMKVAMQSKRASFILPGLLSYPVFATLTGEVMY